MAESARVPSVPGPLSGIRVLDATARLSGPFATMLMADLGATVIKIEPPKAGEPTRSVAPMVGS